MLSKKELHRCRIWNIETNLWADVSEYSSEYEEAMEIIQPILDAEFPEERLGICHARWARQKELLLEKFGISWHTPAELNPDIIFD